MAMDPHRHARNPARLVREIRHLDNLNKSASTSRVLNLSSVYLHHADEDAYKAQPFFVNSQLNRAIILKHNLRANERHLFSNTRRIATKIILPFDPTDLKLGGVSFFFRQNNFDYFARTYLNMTDIDKNPDMKILRLLDALPSLDPFLVREHVYRAGFRPSNCYLRLSPADLRDMGSFACIEMEKLIMAAFGGKSRSGAMKLGGKILSDTLDEELKPLQETMRLTDWQFTEAVFAWRGFLYYKWRHASLQGALREVLAALGSYHPLPTQDERIKNYLRNARPRLAVLMSNAIHRATAALAIYEEAYLGLIERNDPSPFKRFLLNGTQLFAELGDAIGALNHITSYFSFRMSNGRNGGRKRLESIEFADMLLDFEASFPQSETRRLYRAQLAAPRIVTDTGIVEDDTDSDVSAAG
jgi:hypothetical protein